MFAFFPLPGGFMPPPPPFAAAGRTPPTLTFHFASCSAYFGQQLRNCYFFLKSPPDRKRTGGMSCE
jgi:hypothetical protein